MRPAAREDDRQICPMTEKTSKGDFPHYGGTILGPCSPNVFICGKAAARAGDKLFCRAHENLIQSGSGKVRINGLPAARVGDPTTHGGWIDSGSPTVNIG